MERNSHFREQFIWYILNIYFRTRQIASWNYSLCFSLLTTWTIWIIHWDRVCTPITYFWYGEFHPESPVWLQYWYWGFLGRWWERIWENQPTLFLSPASCFVSIPALALKEHIRLQHPWPTLQQQTYYKLQSQLSNFFLKQLLAAKPATKSRQNK